jgi:uncharacterized protein (DUF1778 family)
MPQTVRTGRRHRQTATGRKDDVIQIRASADTKAILNRAAALRGQKLSEFMLDSARRQAEQTILDQRVFFLEPKEHDQFLAQLDAPVSPSTELRTMLTRKAPWEG